MWPALPGTGQEADAVGKTMAGFKVFRGAQATETNVKALHGPRILHLATHGFNPYEVLQVRRLRSHPGGRFAGWSRCS